MHITYVRVYVVVQEMFGWGSEHIYGPCVLVGLG